MKKSIFFFVFGVLLGCNRHQEQLPFLGNPIKKGQKFIYPKVRNFSFVNQDSLIVTNETFKNKIYVADFIFLSCPTICPKMNTELKSVYAKYKNNPSISFLSHTIDPERDTVERLKEFTKNNYIDSNWHFVTGNKDSIFSMATKSYFTTAYPDEKEPGGLVHGGGLLLVDKNRYIRGVYDGTNPEETKRLIRDIKVLLSE
jgi:protein SCO1/2